MGKYRTKTILSISADEFPKQMDDFTANLDGKIKTVLLYSAPESKVNFIDEKGNKGYVYYNIYEAIVIYKPAKHHTKVLIDKFKKFKNKNRIRNKSKK
ncbi:hypothetical protein LCGC14_0371990 [marine sediment metagenome]|uniref:Uncharacterized protein n=1 Tax=marine sediment metagenome TaxID=412755 RepID=A0A0F9TN44_9ZZZZ